MKRCAGCKQALDVARFHRSARSPDGLQRLCKECGNEARRQRLSAQRAAVQAAVGAPDGTRKRCPRCSDDKPVSSFHKNGSSRDGLQSYCKACSTDVQREYLARNAQALALRRAEKLARPVEPAGVKQCNKCGEVKSLLCFYARRSTRDGRSTYCAECQKADARAWNAANKERIRARNATAYAADPARSRRDHRQWWLKLYGLDQEQYQRLLHEQQGRCAICRQPERYVDSRTGEPRRLAVDHSHASGQVRGLLCGACNRGVGQFQDNPDLLRRAADYLDG